MYVRISAFRRFRQLTYSCLVNLALNRVINMFIIGALQIGTIYAKTFNQFLTVRALFGIGMCIRLSGTMTFSSSIAFQ